MNDNNTQSSAAGDVPLLRVQFSSQVETEMLYLLHAAKSIDQLPPPLRKLLQAVNGERLRSVHQLTQAEIANDTYGFARDFQLVLRPEADVEAAIATLHDSPFVAEVRPLRMRRSS